MNKLTIPNGGMPFHGDDVEWMHEGIKEGLKGALYPFVQQYNGNCILAGCDISYAAGDATITEGFVVIGYEVCYCPAQTVAVTSLAASSLKIVSTYDAAGLDVFADSVSRDTYEIRRAAISDGLNSGSEIILENPNRIAYEYDLTPYLQGDWEAQTTELKAIRLGNQVRFVGSITLGDSNLTSISLPTFLRPSQNAYFAVAGVNFAESFIQLKIGSDGSVFPQTQSGQQTFASGTFLSLDGVIYTV